MPPPVLPAQAPTTISTTRMVRDSWGHRLKSAVAKPVVVMMLETVKAASCSAPRICPPYRGRMLKVIAATDARMIPT